MKPTKLVVAILAVFLCGCMGPMYAYNTKIDRINQYRSELDIRTDISPIDREFLYWDKVEREFPEQSSFIDKIRIRLEIASAGQKMGAPKDEDWRTYRDYVGASWSNVHADAKSAEQGHQNQNQHNSWVFRDAAGMMLQFQQQQNQYYNDLNRSLQNSTTHCTSQYRPWGNGMVDTTCY